MLGLADKANGYVFASLATGQTPYPPEFIYGSAIKVRRNMLVCTLLQTEERAGTLYNCCPVFGTSSMPGPCLKHANTNCLRAPHHAGL